MNRPRPEVLYSNELLVLAVELAACPFDSAAPFIGEARSRTCGGAVAISCRQTDKELGDIGLRVSACAVGQAAAAIFAGAATGRTTDEIETARAQIAAWLSGEGLQPAWPGIEALTPALPHSARHEAILLPWNAALAALSKAKAAG